MSSILEKIKQAELVGRGGASFPTWKKWEAVKVATQKAPLDNFCYVVCNASEGEPGVRKDYHILKNFPDRIIDGMKLAMEFLGAEKGYLYINHDYAKELGGRLEELLTNEKIEIFVKPEVAGYIGGEESAALNVIEGKRAEPRLKPPFPVERGLWGCPTLVNNVETYYNVSLVNSDEYERNRFYTIDGDCKNEGVFALAEDFTIEKVLRETGNFPDFPFFIQVGGRGSGEVLNATQLKGAVSGAGSIAVYGIGKKNSDALIHDWLYFFYSESCGQCTACREGTYRLKETLESGNINWKIFFDLLDNLKETSFCALGCATPTPIFSYIENVLQGIENKNDFEKSLVDNYKKSE